MMEGNFLYWLENEYDFGKYSRPLKRSSAKSYISGIRTINKNLGFAENEIYNKTVFELINLRDRIDINENKDRKSHFEALIKFKEKEENVNKLKKINFLSRQQDVLKKQLVEQIAINYVLDHFEELNYTIISKERDNVGWDLEATKGDVTLYIEVKGLSGKEVSFELTPNEYMKSKENSTQYIIAVVTNCLELPILHNYSFDSQTQCWKDRFGNKLMIEEKIAARLSLEK
ncbi:hypothetical protein DF185_15485 [Marinifilum breve]|uniref:Protein NO VEIN C-terminal domain-containing protein n=1 Tax=Marinifilum breve TaxID=2184082 RepID=A0A2V3ZV74_9BACT|nr:DUF3883 domain-containing protein [Marinifilum breve]PXX98779.1 hypothetical protein DF185_15485 [Marinifilum breve]